MSTPNSGAGAPNYRAFISYSRRDRDAAKELQSKLERYVLPRALRMVKPGLRHEPRPLRPVFRDEDELVPGQDLPRRIRVGLEGAEYLLVVCSPAAAASEWVEKEILDFCALGKRDNILAIVVDGYPNAATRGQAPDLECLPRALRFEIEVESEGSVRVTDRPAEPLWVDWRDRARTERPMFLRVVAALLSLGSFDELVQRDRAYRSRQQWLRASAVGLAVLSALVVAVVFGLQTRSVEMRNSDTLAGLSRQALASGDTGSAARYALLGVRDSNNSLFGFEPRAAEDALLGAMLSDHHADPPFSYGGAQDVHAISADGAIIASATGGVIRLWDVAHRRQIQPDLQIGHGIETLAFSPDRRLLAASVDVQSDGYTIEVWDLASRTLLKPPLAGSMPMVTALAFSFDDSRLAVGAEYGDGGGALDLWDLRSGMLNTDHSAGHGFGAPDGISSVAFSHNDRFVAAAGISGTQLMDAGTQANLGPKITAAGTQAGKVIAFSPDDSHLFIGNTQGTLISWDLSGKQEDDTGQFADGAVSTIRFSADGTHLGVLFADGLVKVWDGAHPMLEEADIVDLAPGGDFGFTSDGREVVTASNGDWRTWVLQAKSFAARRVLPGADTGLGAAAFSGDGKTLFFVSNAFSGTIYALDADSLSSLATPLASQGDNPTLAATRDGRLIAVGSSDGVWLIEPKTGRQWRLNACLAQSGSVAFSPDGALLASVCSLPGVETSVLQVWNTRARTQSGATIPLGTLAPSVRFSPDGALLAVSQVGSSPQLWDVATRKRRTVGFTGTSLEGFRPDSRALLLDTLDQGSAASALQFQDVTTGKAIGPRIGEDMENADDVVILSDGQRIAGSSRDGLQLWSLTTGARLGAPFQFGVYPQLNRPEAALVTQDLSELKVVGADGALYTWTFGSLLKLRGEGLARMACRDLLPGSQSRLSADELAKAPILDQRSDADACATFR